MENTPQTSRLMASLEIEEDSLYEHASPNERKMQENLDRHQQSTQPSFVPPINNSKIKSSSDYKMNKSLNNTSLYDSFSVESKYDSFDDSLEEEAQHINQKEINVSQFLSDQVHVTVRKASDKQKFRANYLCDSLEDICSLVSNAEHLSNSDEIENMNNILEKHGIYDDSLRNDICCDKRNASSNEQYFDDDSLAILEFEKTSEDSLDDVASCMDSLILLRNSLGDADVKIEKFNAENPCSMKNHFEFSVPIIYENVGTNSLSEDESFKTAENLNSNTNSQSVSECHMSIDSLEEICDISEQIPELVIPVKPKAEPIEACNANFLSTNVIKNNPLTKNKTETKIETACKSPNTPLNVDNNKMTSSAKIIYNSNDTFETNESPIFFSDYAQNDTSYNSDIIEIVPKWRDVDFDCLIEQNGMRIIRISDEFEEETEVEERGANRSGGEESGVSDTSSISKRTGNIHFDDKTITGKVMSIDSKYVIDNGFATPKCNEDLQKVSKESPCKTPKMAKNSTVNNGGPSVKNEHGTETIKVIKCTGMIDGKLTTTYLDATPILHVYDGQEIEFEVMDFDKSAMKHKSNQESSKKHSESSYDIISSFPASAETNISISNVSSPASHKQRRSHTLSSEGSVSYGQEINATQMSFEDGLKLHIQLPVNKYHGIGVNVSLKKQSSLSKLCESVVENTKTVAEKITAESSTVQFSSNEGIYLSVKSKNDSLEKIMSEAQKKIPSLANGDAARLESTLSNLEKHQNNIDICLSLHQTSLLQALDLHDCSHASSGGEYLQSRDSIMPLNLCIRDKSSWNNRNSLSLSNGKENYPLNALSWSRTEIQKSKSPAKGKCNKRTVGDGDIKKSVNKINSVTKIPIRKADNILPNKLIQKPNKQECKPNSSSRKSWDTVNNKQLSSNVLQKKNPEGSPKKAHHFCMVRNSISRLPKSAQKPNVKKFQNVESPVAKYIGSAKLTPLKATHRYDPNQLLNAFSSSGMDVKAANNAIVHSAQNSAVIKRDKKLRS